MADEGHVLTEEKLKKLERSIKREYQQASRDLQKKLQAYLEETEEKRKVQESLLNAGKITKEEYQQWCFRHTMVGKRWEEMQQVLVDDLRNADKIAKGMMKDEMPDVYALNCNYGMYQIEHDAKIDTGFTLYNHDTAEYLLGDQRQLMPGPSTRKAAEIAANKSMQWNARKIQSAVLQGVLQGETPYAVAKRLQSVATMNYSAAVRYARTMTTSAQNAGRYEAFRRATKLGVDLTIEWQATLDNRTRHDHRLMHGQRTTVDKPFHTPDGFTIYYPADCTGNSDAPQREIWNCRCTLRAMVKGFERDTVKNSPGMGDMTFEEWQNAKPIFDTAEDRKQFAEYTKLLGKDAPKYYNQFQQIKHTDKTAWEVLKEQARMERVIRDAPCELTKRKFTGYFLKPTAKHSGDFFQVGYTENDVRRLRYDMAVQFDLSKAINRPENEYSIKCFDIPMQLGITETGTFITGWQIDKEGDQPRIITAFRKEPKK